MKPCKCGEQWCTGWRPVLPWWTWPRNLHWGPRFLVFVACYLGWGLLGVLLFREDGRVYGIFLGSGAWLWFALDERLRVRLQGSRHGP